MIIPGKITELRRAKGWSKPELGRRVGVSQNTIFKLEAGQTKTFKYLLKLAEVLGCSPEDIDDGLAVNDRTNAQRRAAAASDDGIADIYNGIRDELKPAAREALRAIRDNQPK